MANENINYNLLMESEIDNIVKTRGTKPSLFLHSCCGPCSTAVLSRLQKYFNITVFYYNPNIYPDTEYIHRLHEQKKVIRLLNYRCKKQKEKGAYNGLTFYETPISIKTLHYNPSQFSLVASGHEKDLEGGARCYLCFTLRLEKTAQMAKKLGLDYFCTTLSVSPYKNAVWINEIGQKLSKTYNIAFLPSDFKKREGYKNSILFSREFKLYRQDYCGCVYSLNERLAQQLNNEEYKG